MPAVRQLFFSSRNSVALFAAILLSCSAYAAAQNHQDYPTVVTESFTALANGQAAAAWAQLEPHQEAYGGDLEFDLLLAEAALELERFTTAQLVIKRLVAQLKGNDSANVEARARALYSALTSQRAKRGLPTPSAIALNKARSSVALNINFNRRLLGLPYVGPVTQWQHGILLEQSQDTTAAVKKAPGSESVAESQRFITAGSYGYQQKLVDAKKLISSNNSNQAYELLLPLELEGAGDIDFDYTLGTAAIDSGHADQAIFVLLRVLNQQPNHAAARLELGRAYYANGDFEDAKKQFEIVLTQNPPPFAKKLTQQYLVAIKEQLAVRLTSLTPYVDVRVGFDSNANGATGDGQPFRGVVGVPQSVKDLTLNPQSLEQESFFTTLDAGVLYSKQFKPRWFVRSGGQLSGRINPSAHFVDSRVFSAFGLLEKRVGRNFSSVGMDLSATYLGGDYNASYVGLNLVGGRELSPEWSGLLQLRAATARYERSQAAKDGEDYTLAASLTHDWAGKRQLRFTGGVIGQRMSANTAVNSKDLYGVQFGLSLLPIRSTLMTISLAHLIAEYDQPIVGTQDREDEINLLALAFTRYSSRDPNLKWLLNIDMSATNSSLGLYDSDGIKATVGARYDFH